MTKNHPRGVWGIVSTLHQGSPVDPCSSDIIIQEGRLDVGEEVPTGWQVMDGNPTSSLVMRIVYRYQLEDEANG